MEADAFPAVELLALIGLQRFRPARRDDVFSYHIWRDPLCLSAAPAAVAGIAFSWRRYTFEARRRDHKNRYYKGFCPAPPA
jgi:CRISPR-associated protein Csx14